MADIRDQYQLRSGNRISDVFGLHWEILAILLATENDSLCFDVRPIVNHRIWIGPSFGSSGWMRYPRCSSIAEQSAAHAS